MLKDILFAILGVVIFASFVGMGVAVAIGIKWLMAELIEVMGLGMGIAVGLVMCFGWFSLFFSCGYTTKDGL